MHDFGAATIAQDEETSAVYGMPAAARALDAVDHVLPLTEIAPTLLTLVGLPDRDATTSSGANDGGRRDAAGAEEVRA